MKIYVVTLYNRVESLFIFFIHASVLCAQVFVLDDYTYKLIRCPTSALEMMLDLLIYEWVQLNQLVALSPQIEMEDASSHNGIRTLIGWNIV
jgi:hypothetical protein